MGSLVAGAAMASPFGGGTAEPTFGPAPPPLDGPELPSFRYPLGSQPTKTFDGGTAKEANVTAVPGLREARRRLHDARARGFARAALARQRRRMGLCDRGPLPRHHHRPAKPVRDRRFRSGRRLVLPARPRPFDPGNRARHVRLRAGVRQRLFLRVRHLLASPTGSATRRPRCSAKTFDLPASTFADFPEEGGLYRHGSGAAAAARGAGARLAQRASAHPSLPAARPERRSLSPAAPCARSRKREFPISTTMTGALLIIKPGRHYASCIGTRTRPNGSSTSEAARA